MRENITNTDVHETSKSSKTFKIESGMGVAHLAEAFDMRLSRVELKIGMIRSGDTYSLKNNILYKKSETGKITQIPLEKNDIFLDSMDVPEFPTLKLKRNPEARSYVLVNLSGKSILAGNSIEVPYANIDLFSKALAKISGEFIVKAGVHSSMKDLQKHIKPLKAPSGQVIFPNTVEIDSGKFWDFNAAQIDFNPLLRLTYSQKPITAVDFAKGLAGTLPLPQE